MGNIRKFVRGQSGVIFQGEFVPAKSQILRELSRKCLGKLSVVRINIHGKCSDPDVGVHVSMCSSYNVCHPGQHTYTAFDQLYY